MPKGCRQSKVPWNQLELKSFLGLLFMVPTKRVEHTCPVEPCPEKEWKWAGMKHSECPRGCCCHQSS